MKVYRWEETEQHWLGVMRPDALFDLSSREPGDFAPDFKEGFQRARHRITGRMEAFAYVWNKQFGESASDRESVEVMMEDWPDRYRQADESDLKFLGLQESLQK